MDWTARLRAAFGDRAPDADIVEELAQHAADAFQSSRADGCDEAEAAAIVDRQIAEWAHGAPALTRRPRTPPAPVPPPPAPSRLTGLLNDLRYALRVLRRQPGYTATAIVTLALGIGATTIIFSVLYGVLLKPLPWPAGERLVRVSETRRGATSAFGAVLTNAGYLPWRDHPATLEGLAGWSSGVSTLADGADPQRVRVVSVTPGLFPLLGVRPVLGALFREGDEVPGSEKVVVLSHALWTERFGGSRSVVGRAIRLDGQPHRVAAVMPASFAFPDREARAWVPLFVPPVSDGKSEQRTLSMFAGIGRLRPGVTPAQAAAEGTARAHGGTDLGLVGIAVFGTKALPDVVVTPFLQAQTADVRPAILVFFAAVGLLLVTATANVASLQLARATGRRREIAIRTALGASVRSLARQFLVESSLVGLAGGAAGVVLALGLHRALPALLPAGFPRLDEISIGLPVLALALVASLASGVAFGLLPALQARRLALVDSLSEDGLASVGASAGSRTHRARAFIIAGQVAVACLLLLGALLLGRSFHALLTADRGYQPEHVLTAALPLPDSSYTGHRRAEIASHLLARVRQLPGVTAAAITATLPLAGGEILSGFTMPARDGSGTVQARAAIRNVSPGYFAALGVRLVSGRVFTDADTPASLSVVIVNRSFARRYLREPAVGQRVQDGSVVGVVEDVHQFGVTDPTQPELYLCYPQSKEGLTWDEPKIVIRTSGDPLRLAPAVRTFVRELDPTVPVDNVRTMEERVSTNLARPRLYAVLLGGFAAFALVIAAVGLFGVLSYSVAQRSREIGVRTALGARPSDIVRLVVGQGLRMTAAGAAGGLVLSFFALKSLSALLYGITIYDAWSYAAVIVGILAASALACAVPARRAARVDPVRALRA